MKNQIITFTQDDSNFKHSLLMQLAMKPNRFLTSKPKGTSFGKLNYKVLLVFLALIILTFPASAQDTIAKGKWSLETSLTFPPAAQIYMLKASYQFSECSVLGLGTAFQNWKNTDKSPRGQANAYTLLLSYRYFFWKNFHIELELWPAYNHFNSFVDGKTYKGLELWVEYKVGYKVNLTNHLFLNLQPGLAHGLWMQNKWPEYVDYSSRDMIKNSLVFVPQVMLGWNF
ncbi:MAG: hypothetical protein CVT98_09280 [Bacteroidetes bacterium HGW-Bacteroidetes-15]|nr:MAG: hypothetical protein CVT98_09280 [Bacteroidetes bacterium HGW-Bacteroidetes-15]